MNRNVRRCGNAERGFLPIEPAGHGYRRANPICSGPDQPCRYYGSPMPENDPDPEQSPNLRVSDAERTAAMDALGEHLSAGRLDVDEYGNRSAQLAAARTTADLRAPFADLPAPHPAGPVTTSASAGPLAMDGYAGSGLTPASGPVPAAPARSKGQQIAAAVSGGAGIIAVIAFFLLSRVWDGAWLVFLLIPLAYLIAGAVWGPDWRNGGGRDRSERHAARARRRGY